MSAQHHDPPTREWSSKQRLLWWVKLIALSIPIGTALSAGAIASGKWALTRASTDDVDAAARTAIETAHQVEARLEAKKEDKDHSLAEVRRVESKVDSSAAVISNVRDNLIIIMGRQGLEPKPIPPPTVQP